MKQLLCLSLLLLLCGCQALTALPTGTEPTQLRTEATQPPVLIMSSPDSDPLPPCTEPAGLEPAAANPEPFSTIPESAPLRTAESVPSSEPAAAATEEPLGVLQPLGDRYPYGDTTSSWRPELAEAYPPDTACSAARLLEKWMAVEGLTLEDLEARSCAQLILTAAQPTDGVETLTVCYERSADGVFRPVPGLDRFHGYVGKNGIMHDRRRNTGTSPAGLWAIGPAFGNEVPPEDLKLPWRQVTPNSDWVCDEDSPYFNSWQERGDPSLIPWSDDVEHLEDYPIQYAWACVIEFNRPPDAVPDRGCAIFLHCSERGTGGCVGLRREDMLSVLQWLDADKHPYILISGAQSA